MNPKFSRFAFGGLFFVLYTGFLIFVGSKQLLDNQIYNISFSGDVYSRIMIFGIIVFLIIGFLMAVFSINKNFEYKVKREKLLGYISLFSAVLILGDIFVNFAFGIDKVSVLNFVFIILSFIGFLVYALGSIGLFKFKNGFNYLLFSPIFLYLIRLVENFTGTISAYKINHNFINTIYMCCMVLFLHMVFKSVILNNSFIKMPLAIFTGIIGSFFGFFISITNIVHSIFESGVSIAGSFYLTDAAISLYSIVFILLLFTNQKITER